MKHALPIAALAAATLLAGVGRGAGDLDDPVVATRGPSLPVAVSAAEVGAVPAGRWSPRSSEPATTDFRAVLTEVVERYCTRCHNERSLRGNLSLEDFDVARAAENAETAERMIRKLRAGMMPPPGARRPTPDTLAALALALEEGIDAAAGRAHIGERPFQRLNRAEYARVVHDLLGLTVDPESWLPPDPITDGFDNIASSQTLSPTLMDAYLAAASDIARRAVGDRDAAPISVSYNNPPTLSQHEWERAEGAPFGTRGGISALHSFPADGEYTFEMSFMSGWGERFHDIDVSVDGERVALVRYGGDIDFQGRKGFPLRTEPVFIRAGERRLAAAFVRTMDGPYEDLIRPHDWSLTGTEASYGTTSLPHLMSLTVEGPHNPSGVSDFPARRRIFSCRPTAPGEAEPCAREIVSRLAAGAYGRDPGREEIDDLLDFFRLGSQEGGFEAGIRTSLEAILASPHFIFRMERQRAGVGPGDIYPVAADDLASRLSFFLWGRAPDDELVRAARDGSLVQPEVLERQARRMLADPRSVALATRFASLWLRLQDVDKVEPDALRFPNYSRQLAVAMRRETELFFDDLVRRDGSLTELLGADHTFVNERLAGHYGIDGVHGESFRRVAYPNERRRGILGHGSVLVQTSLGNRTSPVLRGKWVMEVLLGTPPPPPPPGIPDLEETESALEGRTLTTRERLEMHASNPNCASCHNLIDPIGLALDNFDVTGRWRLREGGAELDTRGTFYDGTEIETPADLARVLLKRPVPLARHFTESLMAYAYGREIEYRDQPTVRRIAGQAAAEGYRMSAFVLGVAMSEPFRMKEVGVGEGG